METKLIFLVVFLSQIIILSYYYPRNTSSRIRKIIDKYPPDQYPKLYPMSADYYKKKLKHFEILNWVLIGLGLGLIFMFIGNFPEDSHRERWDTMVTFAFFMAQFFPVLLLEISSFNILKEMRKGDKRSVRKAEILPRKIFDFISPLLLVGVVGVYIGFVVFIIYFNQLDYPWFGGYTNIWIISGGNIFFIGLIAWNLYGKKLDPYLRAEDRRKQLSLTIKQLATISIMMTIYAAFNIVAHAFELRHFTSTFMSIYFQLIGFISLNTLQLDDINFDVYKEDVNPG